MEILAAMPQFVPTDTSGTLMNALSGCFVTARNGHPGIVVKSAGGITALEDEALSKYIAVADMQATLLVAGKR